MHNRNKYSIGIPIIILIILTVGYFFISSPKKLLLAPMIGGVDLCLFMKQQLEQDSPNAKFTKLCMEDSESASKLITATLTDISTKTANEMPYRLGYTLYVPLLKLFEKTNGAYEISKNSVSRVINTIKNTDAPVILYLFSNHFEVDSPVEMDLSESSSNLLTTIDGPLKIDTYYGAKIFPWSFVRLDNNITHLREVAFNKILDELCAQDRKTISRVEGVTVLGELHHMYPDFQGGMGFESNYRITDYSESSVEGFRYYLTNKFKNIDSLNKILGSSFSNFDKIFPPSKDIRKDTLNNYFEHIDAYAHGKFPITGWAASLLDGINSDAWVHIYSNGKFIARTPVTYSRQDVLAAHPNLSSAEVGWRYDFDFSNEKPGLYEIDIFLKFGNGPLNRLSNRTVAVMGRNQAEPKKLEQLSLPDWQKPVETIIFSVDLPKNSASYYFNPLVVLWHEYRESQISNYLNHFADLTQGKCLNRSIIYSHQILPFVNPGWDESRFSVGSDLAVPKRMGLGVSLYGEATYGVSFRDWFRSSNRNYYGVTEFHPLRGMKSDELKRIFEEHKKSNAQFISFFINGVGLDEDKNRKLNLFSFDKNNKNAGSDMLFKSVKSILNENY